ncbi:hypothetical protein J6590_018856 [Homalodisca vitripennis]|nr:hypothetical protein J6590_018856 [Homalodisca vitripennis]
MGEECKDSKSSRAILEPVLIAYLTQTPRHRFNHPKLQPSSQRRSSPCYLRAVWPLLVVRPRHDRRKTDARPQLYALAAQTKRETSLTLRPDFHELL